MIGFLAGAIAGGLAMVFWGDRLKGLLQDKSRHAPDTGAHPPSAGGFDAAREHSRTGPGTSEGSVRVDDRRTTNH